ncbi:MAG: DNA topoisomerase I, partial [Chlamydiales bacterium]|nr:DNA topoisomerase I [Chlamydiales bacterium]
TKKKAASKKKAPAKKKSASKKDSTEKKNPPKKERVKRTPASFKCSELLQSIIAEENSTRGDAIKKLWDYIRKNNLQDPEDKRVIKPDALLSKLFETEEPVSMFKFSSFISKHLLK